MRLCHWNLFLDILNVITIDTIKVLDAVTYIRKLSTEMITHTFKLMQNREKSVDFMSKIQNSFVGFSTFKSIENFPMNTWYAENVIFLSYFYFKISFCEPN